jgi:hypothetical protein
MSDITDRLRAAAEDPMWANHAEVSKRTLFEAADTIDALRENLKDAKASYTGCIIDLRAAEDERDALNALAKAVAAAKGAQP